MKQTNKIKIGNWLTFSVLVILIGFSSCKKDLTETTTDTSVQLIQKIKLPETTNPYSLRNVKKAQETLSLNAALRVYNFYKR